LYGKEITEKYGWVFLEMATGGELFDRLIDSGSLSERAAWPYTKAIAEALRHCYSKGIVHRDLKLENVMLSAEDPHAIRLIDFGLAARLNMQDGKVVDTTLKDNAGTQAYRAPEVANKNGYSALKVDVWALGIILFSLVSGFFPMQEAKTEDWRYERLAKDQAKGVGASESIFKTYKRTCPFSADLKALVDAMLTIDPAKRISVEEICESAWLAKAPSAPKKDDGDGVVYRGTMDADEDEMMEEFSVPEDAIPLERQKAQRHFDGQMPA